jgi:pyruvate formate lyase activating enzyme
MDKGVIFDIRRFSTHDGDGIRTTIFFKGCPLSCVWCHNPEGISFIKRPLYFEKKCIRCLGCVKHSKNNGVTFENGSIHIHPDAEEDWKQLVDLCPSTALMFDSREYSLDEIIEEVLKDKPFFKYGGGVTLSGGEPLAQIQFVEKLLMRLKSMGINTAIETALFVPQESVKRALPYLDQIYADLKIFDSDMQKKYTGVPNERIKENIKFLLESDKKENVIIRTPLIPTFTAYEENIGKIAEYISGIYPEVHYELLNYNPMAEGKYYLVDREYCFKENPKAYTKEQLKAFGNIARKHGIKNLISDI